MKQCPHAVNFSSAAASHIRDLQSKDTSFTVHIVVAYICRKLDDLVNMKEDTIENGNENDDVVFEEMLMKAENGIKNEER